MLLARLLSIIDGCLCPSPATRWTIEQVLDSLTELARDMGSLPTGHVTSGAAAIAGCGPGPGTPPPTTTGTTASASAGTPGPKYDVLAIVSAMEALSIDTTAVIDTIGGVMASPLDVLRAAGVPYMKCLAVKTALSQSSTDTGTSAAGGAGATNLNIARYMEPIAKVWLFGPVFKLALS